MNILDNLSDKFTEYHMLFQDNPKMFIKLVLLFIVLIISLILIGYLVELITQLWHDRIQESKGVLLEILPKETTKQKETEVLIRNIHAVLLNTRWRKLLYGRPYISYEIVADKEKIKFYVKVPKDYKDILIERIYSTYSEVAINEVEDYLEEKVWVSSKDILVFLCRLVSYPFNKIPFKVPKNHLNIAGTEMELGFHHVLKIKTKIDKDILGSILSSMKNLEWHEKIVVQVLARPLDNSWQIKGRKVLEAFERNGIRPKRGSDFSNIFVSLLDQLGDDVNNELEKAGVSGLGGSISNKKTRSDRREITVASEKLIEPGFETVIRVMGVGHYRKSIKSRVKGITAAWNELDQENRFKRDVIFAKRLLYKRAKARRMYLVDRQNILTSSELANFFLRVPGSDLIDQFPNIEYLKIKEFAPPRDVETHKNILAKNIYRGQETLIGIRDKDLVRHMVIQGRTGSGKSEWIKTLLCNHIKRGLGMMLLEPHGKLADEFLELIPKDRWKDVIYFDLFDSHPPEFNFCKVFKRPGVSYEDQLEKTTEEVIEIFKRNFSDAWSGKNEYYITNAIKTIIELQQGTIVDIQRLFVDKDFRDYATKNIKDEQVKNFWKSEFAEQKNGKLSPGTESTVLSVMYKIGKFLNSKKLLRAVGQEGCIDFKDILDNNKIIIFRFSKENMSEDRISFLGGIALKLLIVAAFARDKKRWGDPFIIALDEAQNFVNKSIETVLDELRKYGIALVPMHQRLAQMNKVEGLVDAIYGNVGTTITFTVGQPDAPYFEKIYGPRVDEKDLVKLPSRYGYCKMLVDGETSDTFNIYSLDRPTVDKAEGKKAIFEIKKYNRENRLHYKQIDKMLKERIENYNGLNEVGDSAESSGNQSFVEMLDEPYNVVDQIENYKGYMAAVPPIMEEAAADVAVELENEYNYIEEDDEGLSLHIENMYKAHEEESEGYFNKLLDSWIEDNDVSDKPNEDIEIEENMMSDEKNEVLIKDLSEEKIYLADFLDDDIYEASNEDIDHIENELIGAEIINFDGNEEIIEEFDNDDLEETVDPSFLWEQNKKIEDKAMEMSQAKAVNTKEELAKNLWDMAKEKEKSSK